MDCRKKTITACFPPYLPIFVCGETTYFHVMPSHQSIVEWYKGTGLRPYLAQLSEDESLAFQHDLLQAIEREFPLQPDGRILFPFPRLFFTARA